MNVAKFEANIIAMIEEQQIKLGYLKEKVRLYYPLASINYLLETNCSADEMTEQLNIFCQQVRDHLGSITFSHEKERFCITIPPEGSEYIHTTRKPNEFIEKLIGLVGTHGTTMMQIETLFRAQNQPVSISKTSHGEFDYLIFFESGIPDDFLYCFKEEGHHIIYHRFTKGDYEDFGLSDI